jgi:WD40 repeat protein
MKSGAQYGRDPLNRYHVHQVSKYVVVYDGNFLCVFSSSEGNLPLIRHFCLSEVVKRPTAICPVAVSESSDKGGCQFYVANSDGQVILLCALTKTEVKKVFSGSDTVIGTPPNKKARQIGRGKSITALHDCVRSRKPAERAKKNTSHSLLAVGYDDGMVSLLESNKGENLNNNSEEERWKADDCSIDCVQLSPCCESLLTAASTSVKLWDCATKQVQHTFNQFTSSVQRLFCMSDPMRADDKLIISASLSDNYFVAWNSQSELSTNFALSSKSIQLSASSSSVLTYPLYMCSCNADGSAQLFTINVNGKVAKSCLTIRISDTDEKSASVPIVSSVFSKSESAVYLLYGAAPNLIPEKVSLKGNEKSVVHLRRADPRKLSASMAKSQLSQHAPATANAKKATAAKLVPKPAGGEESQSDPSLMELLQQELESESKNVETTRGLAVKNCPAPKVAGSQSILLMQAISSDDSKTLTRIYQIRNPAYIRPTVKNMKGPQAYILFKDLVNRVERTSNDDSYVCWLKEVVSVHMHYLQSCKGIESYFDKMNKLTNQEKRFVEKIRHVNAKLDVVLTRAAVQAEEPGGGAAGAAVFQDNESDEEDNKDDEDESDEAAGYFSMDGESDGG